MRENNLKLESIEKYFKEQFPNENSMDKKSEFIFGAANENRKAKRVLLSIDLSIDSIRKAVCEKYDLIITTNLLLNQNKKITNKYIIQKFSLLTKYPVIIYHLNPLTNFQQNFGPYGILTKILSLENQDAIFTFKKKTEYPIGLICVQKSLPNTANIPNLRLKDILIKIRKQVKMPVIEYAGKLNQILKSIALILGYRQLNPNIILKCKEKGCDCIIVSDFSFYDIIYALEQEISVVKVPIWKIYDLFFKKLANYLSVEFPLTKFDFFLSHNPIKQFPNENLNFKNKKYGEQNEKGDRF